MRPIIIIATIIAAVIASVLLALSQRPAPQPAAPSSSLLAFVAPSLIKLVKDAVAAAGYDVSGVRSIGSVQALRLIQQGQRPDLYASVDVEYLKYVQNSSLAYLTLGSYKLVMLCRRPIGDGNMTEVKWILVDPGSAPAGYRQLAAGYFAYLLYKTPLYEVYNGTGVSMYFDGRELHIYSPSPPKSTDRAVVASNLDVAFSYLETGQAACMFAYVPLLVAKGLWPAQPAWRGPLNSTAYIAERGGVKYYIYVLPPRLDFTRSPEEALGISAYLHLLGPGGEVVMTTRIGAHGAFVAAFTQKGVDVLNKIRAMDLAKYGFEG